MLQASLRPYDVPVFQAIFGKCSVLPQLTGKSGRLTFDKTSLIIKAAAGLNTRFPAAVSTLPAGPQPSRSAPPDPPGPAASPAVSSIVYLGRTHLPSFAKME